MVKQCRFPPVLTIRSVFADKLPERVFLRPSLTTSLLVVAEAVCYVDRVQIAC
jgi:hypothetical protein